jgi:two-component system NtrC family sensor kinase
MDRVGGTPGDGAVGVLDTQEQKLEEMGRLIAGIAHELSSPIQFIGHSVEFLRDAIGNTQHQRREIEQAMQDLDTGVAQATLILRAMKQLSHPGTGDPCAVNLNEAVESAALVARHEVRRVAELALELGDLPPVVCHPVAVRQAIVNLLVNAADAVEDARGALLGPRGKVRLRTQRDGDQAVISVSDSGTGIPDAIRERIFEPFFTTKQPGRGTGQGLAIVREIVAQHGGALSLATAEGRGSTFTIRLPIRGLAGVLQ